MSGWGLSDACMLIGAAWAMDTALGLLAGQDVVMTGAAFASVLATAAICKRRERR